MPGTKSKSKRRYKRRYKKRMYSLSHLRSPAPPRFFTKLTYVEQFILSPSIGTSTNYTFSANGLYDPNITSTGHQPRGFDEWTFMYDHAVTLKSSISVHAAIKPTGAEPGILAVSLVDGVTTPPIQNNMLEGGYTNWTLVEPITKATASVRHRCDVGKFLGRKSPLSDPELKSSTSSNPTEQAYYQISYGPLNTTAQADVLDVIVMIDYLVAFIEPKIPSQS